MRKVIGVVFAQHSALSVLVGYVPTLSKLVLKTRSEIPRRNFTLIGTLPLDVQQTLKYAKVWYANYRPSPLTLNSRHTSPSLPFLTCKKSSCTSE